ncbi:MAG: aldolase/citrate lyase family protein, partial [Tepidiformaceae bacterium]
MKLRSIVAVGTAGEGLSDALNSPADAILLTLATDARPAGSLRNTAIEALHAINEAGKHGIVVVNHPRTGLLRDDLDAIVSANLHGVLLPHAVEPQDVRDIAVLLREFELGREIEPGTVAVFPIIDSARGLLRAAAITEGAPRVGGLVFGSAAYARDIGARAEEKGPRLAYARGAVVAAARAFDRQ